MGVETNSQEAFEQFMAGLPAARAIGMAERAVGLITEGMLEEGDPGRDWPPRAAVSLLGSLAGHANREIAEAVTSRLFREGIERINDSFAASAEERYRRLFSQLIDFWRSRPEGNFLAEGLRSFSLGGEESLAARHRGLASRPGPTVAEQSAVRKVLFLSRVTVGADVAITSVLMAALREALPGVERVLLGAERLRELYGGEAGLQVRPIDYPRGGSLLARLQSWPATLAVIDRELEGLGPGEGWVIDPDSRLSQLGLLPLLKADRGYYHFPSRGHRIAGEPAAGLPLGRLAARWIERLLGDTLAERRDNLLPYLALPRREREVGSTLANWMRSGMEGADATLTTVSFGVGGNAAKRLTSEHETAILHHLTRQGRVILDSGGSAEERATVEEVVAPLQTAGVTVSVAREGEPLANLLRDTPRPAILRWEGGIGSLAGLIAASDRYLGYDSSGQHLAAALGVRGLTLFLTDNPPAFAERWRPTGKGEVQVLCPAPTIPIPELLRLLPG
jgi:ADP-heptose:LPS heptosyltransferase